MSSTEFFRTVSFHPIVDGRVCTGCGTCISVCRTGAILPALPQMKASPEHGVCRNCRLCVESCRPKAVSITAQLGGSTAGTLKKNLWGKAADGAYRPQEGGRQ